MATSKTTRQVIVTDEHSLYESEPNSLYPDEAQEEILDASLCLSCGEPLAWHEVACSTSPVPIPEADASEETSTLLRSPASCFAYALGQPVQPTPGAPARNIIWRGQMKERHPRTKLWLRVNVYQLDDGHWDCYREDELQAA
ncbi:hypothetical protein [Hymenobacter sp. GOD-10R]|uniref:hypothetical protein n=1 Tax=Hymenobacter sp. GOD-10R TaxID=3093922 RepID=UPI002D785CD1|nr:hypothetical protein [Hymenobacter sp. GOD-10R]WRQ26243.1 hypothetical protein SD425_14260 [Hymenobacter sp. GOD-10R]